MHNVQSFLILVASILSSLGVAITFVYKYILQPLSNRLMKQRAKEMDLAHRERMQQEKEYQDKIVEITKNQMTPFIKAFEELQECTRNSGHDLEKLTEIAQTNVGKIDEHEKRLDDHNVRIRDLETRNKVLKEIKGDK